METPPGRELVEVADGLLRELAPKQSRYKVTERPDGHTIRYYITQKLLPRPESYEGGRARYSGQHLTRLLLLKKLQAEHYTLQRIAGVLETASDEDVLRDLFPTKKRRPAAMKTHRGGPARRGLGSEPRIGARNVSAPRAPAWRFARRATVRYLWNLHQLGKISELSSDLRRAASEGTALADQAAEAHGIERLPQHIQTAADACAAATSGDASSAEKYFAEALDFSGDDVTVREIPGRVDSRATLAYAAASFIAMSQLEKGVRLANQVTRQFNDQGRLYSTLDSVAAIVLMIQLRSSGLVSGEGRLRVNGKEMTVLDATSLSDQIESVS